MITIDTNILVRYITQDDEIQSKTAEDLLSKYNGKPQSIFINNIVLCELVWVLDRGYKYSKEQIAATIRIILATTVFTFEHHNILWIALEDYDQNKADFADCLIVQLNKFHGFHQTFTFDKSAIKHNLFILCNS